MYSGGNQLFGRKVSTLSHLANQIKIIIKAICDQSLTFFQYFFSHGHQKLLELVVEWNRINDSVLQSFSSYSGHL